MNNKYYTVGELIEQLQKCDPRAIVEISDMREGKGFTVQVKEWADRIRMNVMEGWGVDIEFPAYVTLTAGSELVHMEPHDHCSRCHKPFEELVEWNGALFCSPCEEAFVKENDPNNTDNN